MKIIKFGGKSLENGKGISQTIKIIQRNYQQNTNLAIVVSARGKATDELLHLIALAKKGEDFSAEWADFQAKQNHLSLISLQKYFDEVETLLSGIKLLEECSDKTQDRILAYGEIISVNYLAAQLEKIGIAAKAIDAGDLFLTNDEFGNAAVNFAISEAKTQAYFNSLESHILPIVTGFIAKNSHGERTTLGRNGSNYSASLLANFLNADLLENYTHVDGIFTGNPDEIHEAVKIEQLSYADAAELAQFGANILHAKTIEPLQQKDIALKILNTFGDDAQTGTLITANPEDKTVRALASLKNKALIHFEGKGLLGKVGVDGRIFKAFQNNNISVGMISQGSSERGIAMVVSEDQAEKAVKSLKQEFKEDIEKGDVDEIFAEKGLGVLAIIGLNLNQFDKPYRSLVRNQITPKLFNNTITGNTICLLLTEKELNKAIQVIHGELFDQPKKVHIAVIGHGLVGKTLIEQILVQRKSILEEKNIDLRIFAIANSQKVLLAVNGVQENWEELKKKTPQNTDIQKYIISFAQQNALENLIMIDNTASENVAKSYALFAENGFDIVSSNKIANTLPYSDYQKFRKVLKRNNKKYYYETNVGAGLPLIDTIKLLHLSGENITRIKGVFSGSLSYLFNHYSIENKTFEEVVLEAKEKGYTEPDPREDLSGNDVARKLLILARELKIPSEFEDVQIQNLIPEALKSLPKEEFFERMHEMNPIYQQEKDALQDNEVLRYVGDLQWDNENQTSSLEVKLVKASQASALGQIKGADSIFEIYTESYGDQPLVIQGAGAGAKVTARGVFGDVLRISEILD